MAYIHPLDPAAADAETAATLNDVKRRLGMVPKLYATLAKAPAALEALLKINQAVGAGSLSAKEREIVALEVAPHMHPIVERLQRQMNVFVGLELQHYQTA